MRVTTIRQYQNQTMDIEKIRTVAGNPELSPDDVFDFPKFIIARSGRNHNRTEVTPEAQTNAVKDWIGKPVYFEDHKTSAKNQIGRIYDSWIETESSETVTYGKAYAVVTDSDKDIQTKIKNRIHKEMSCGYEVKRSECSICKADTSKSDCSKCNQNPAYFAKDLEIVPDHISFVGRPAIDGAGLVTNSRETDQQSLLADDGKLFRDWASKEFSRWYQLNNPKASTGDIDALTGKLTAREMINLARVEQSRFQEIIPSGAQQLTAPAVEQEQPVAPQYKRIADIFSKGNR